MQFVLCRPQKSANEDAHEHVMLYIFWCEYVLMSSAARVRSETGTVRGPVSRAAATVVCSECLHGVLLKSYSQI